MNLRRIVLFLFFGFLAIDRGEASTIIDLLPQPVELESDFLEKLRRASTQVELQEVTRRQENLSKFRQNCEWEVQNHRLPHFCYRYIQSLSEVRPRRLGQFEKWLDGVENQCLSVVRTQKMDWLKYEGQKLTSYGPRCRQRIGEKIKIQQYKRADRM